MKSLFNYYYARTRRDLSPQEKQKQMAQTALDRLDFLAEAYERQSRRERQPARLAQRFTQTRQ
jgi:hypothetical protein